MYVCVCPFSWEKHNKWGAGEHVGERQPGYLHLGGRPYNNMNAHKACFYSNYSPLWTLSICCTTLDHYGQHHRASYEWDRDAAQWDHQAGKQYQRASRHVHGHGHAGGEPGEHILTAVWFGAQLNACKNKPADIVLNWQSVCQHGGYKEELQLQFVD